MGESQREDTSESLIGGDNAGIVSTRQRIDTQNKKGTNMIYYCNTRTITEHGLGPVTLQNFVVTIVILPILLLPSEVPSPRLNTFSLIHS